MNKEEIDKLINFQERKYETIFTDLHERITKLTNIMIKFDKRIVWCEENLKTNFKVKTSDNRYLKSSPDGKVGYVVDSDEEDYQDLYK